MEDVLRRVAAGHPYLRLHRAFRFVPRSRPSLPPIVPVASTDQLRAGERVHLVLPWATIRYVVVSPTYLRGERTEVVLVPLAGAFAIHMLAGQTLVWGTRRARLPLFRSPPRR